MKRGFQYFLFIAFADELANKATNGPNNSLLTETKNKMTSDMYITQSFLTKMQNNTVVMVHNEACLCYDRSYRNKLLEVYQNSDISFVLMLL